MLDDVVEHARESLPLECCGLLLGAGDRVDLVFRAHNAEESPTRFQVDPLDHFAAIRAARTTQRRIIGVYHSHPTSSADPSPSDLAEASYTEYLYLIVGAAGGPDGVRVFRLEEGRFVSVPYTIVD